MNYFSKTQMPPKKRNFALWYYIADGLDNIGYQNYKFHQKK